MKEITPQLTGTLAARFAGSVPRGDAYPVATFGELARIVAELSNLNREYLLFFRGQARDFRNKAGASTLYPSLYRKNLLSRPRLTDEFARLRELSNLLVEETGKVDRKAAEDLRRRPYVRWAMLQHYQVYETPLLDLTQSLRAACSFAQAPAPGGQAGDREFGYVYALGLPYPSSAVSLSTEQEIVGVRLIAACPALAKRPHFQEGFLAGTPELTDNYGDKNELDFNRRLVAKFAIPLGGGFWDCGQSRVPEDLLFPTESEDPMRRVCEPLRGALRLAEGSLFAEPVPDDREADGEPAADGGVEALAARLRRKRG